MTRLRGVRCPSCGGAMFVPAVDNHGKAYTGCARCSLVPATPGRSAASLAGPSLERLVAARNQIALMQGHVYAVRLTDDHIATIAYALGVLSAERLAAGERLDDGKAAP